MQRLSACHFITVMQLVILMLIGGESVSVRNNNSWLCFIEVISDCDNAISLLVLSSELATSTCGQQLLLGKWENSADLHDYC